MAARMILARALVPTVGCTFMDLNHLHLHVADVDRARAFYETYFRFRFHVMHGSILFLRNAEGFDLALAPAGSEEIEPFPVWFHFGFRLASAALVRAAFRKMRAGGVRIRDDGLTDDRDLVSFRCYDPDGHGIEVYWETEPRS